MNIQKISIILEILSFVLVTLDLYGKDRLLKLAEYFKRKDSKGVSGNARLLITVILIICVVCLFINLNYISEYLERAERESNDLARYIVYALVFFGSYYLLIGIYKILAYFNRLAIKFLQKFDFPYFMILLGTFLFLLSKFLCWKMI